MAAATLPTPLEASSPPPPLFDGTTRLYTCYTCPFAQRVWITRNYKGLQDKIELVGINLQNRPEWYKEKVNPANKVPALEHNGKIIVESLDLIKYVDTNFEGPSLYPEEPAKREFGEELLTYAGEFVPKMYGSFKGDAVAVADAEFDYLEKALENFDDGPFFLGQFSLVDIAYAPFVERFSLILADVWKYDFTAGRPKLAQWWAELNKIDAYTETKADPDYLLTYYKSRFVVDVAYAPLIERFHLFFADVWKYDFTVGRPKLAEWWEEMNKVEAYKETMMDRGYLLAYLKSLFVAQK